MHSTHTTEASPVRCVTSLQTSDNVNNEHNYSLRPTQLLLRASSSGNSIKLTRSTSHAGEHSAARCKHSRRWWYAIGAFLANHRQTRPRQHSPWQPAVRSITNNITAFDPLVPDSRSQAPNLINAGIQRQHYHRASSADNRSLSL